MANRQRSRRDRLITLFLTAACSAYLIWKIDLAQTIKILEHAKFGYFLGGAAIAVVALIPLAWRWQRLLGARAVDDRLLWLTRTYYVSYAVGQVLPTALGGDAVRIVSTTRRHPERASAAVGSVLLERALGGAATLLLAAIGFALAIGRYDVGPYLWLEGLFVVATIIAAGVFFSARMRAPLRRLRPFLRRVRLERPLRTAYEGIHGYRAHAGLVTAMFALTLVVQAFRVASIWMLGRSVGVPLSPRPYFVMGPMLFLVMLVPFTINGIALREAFFVSFLGKLHIDADAAFATGFLFFVLSLVLGTPGAFILAFEAIRPQGDGRQGDSSNRQNLSANG